MGCARQEAGREREGVIGGCRHRPNPYRARKAPRRSGGCAKDSSDDLKKVCAAAAAGDVAPGRSRPPWHISKQITSNSRFPHVEQTKATAVVVLFVRYLFFFFGILVENTTVQNREHRETIAAISKYGGLVWVLLNMVSRVHTGVDRRRSEVLVSGGESIMSRSSAGIVKFEPRVL